MAKATLPKADFLKFCNEIGQKATDSTIRKYLAIGCAYDKFIEYADKLPNSWTTLYLITQIPADIFSELIKGNESLTNLRGAQIKRMISIGSGSNCNDENSLVYISAGNEIGSDAQATNQISPDSSNNLSDIDVNQKSSGIDKSISAIHSTGNLMARITPSKKLLRYTNGDFIGAVIRFRNRSPSIVEWNTLMQQLKILVGFEELNLVVDYSKDFEVDCNKRKKLNRRQAMAARKYKKEQQKKIDEKDFAISPFFKYGDGYDSTKGEYV